MTSSSPLPATLPASPTADGIARAWLDADADDSFAADLAKGRADRTAARQWAAARAFSSENALAQY
jgi:hypothetical protein